MASSSSSSNTWMLSMKALFISTGVVSVSMGVKFAVPLMLNFAVYDLPVVWSVIVSWLKPPYLYVVINGIIISIAASSRFQHRQHSENQSQELVDPPHALPASDLATELRPVPIQASFGVLEHPAVVYEVEPRVMEEPPVIYESEPPVIDVEAVSVNGSEVVGIGDEDEFVISRSTWNATQRIINATPPPEKVQPEFILPVREKQLVTSRFAHHRKPKKTSQEGVRALRVLKPKKHDTLENTWKMITDGRHMPLTRHLRNSDTFENHHNSPDSGESALPTKMKVVKKTETFKDRTNFENQNHRPPPSTNSSPASGGKLRKDGSLSHDELNLRVEAFIKKFNDDMRLQRQQSLNQYMEMVNRGAH